VLSVGRLDSVRWWEYWWSGKDLEGNVRVLTEALSPHFAGVTREDKVASVLWKHMGEYGYSSSILDLVIRWRWVVSFRPLPLYLRGKSPRYPLDRRLRGPQSPPKRCEEEKNLALPGIEPGPSSPLLYQLSYPDFPLAWRDWGKPQETSVRIVIMPTEIRTEYFPNTIPVPYHYTNPFGMKMYGGVAVHLHPFLTSARWAPLLGCFTSKRVVLGTYWILGRVSPRTNQGVVVTREIFVSGGNRTSGKSVNREMSDASILSVGGNKLY
jgi:hypothetical protein